MKPGDFPFPLPEGAQESRYLTWLRNHSNYMATRGLLDYFRMAGVLVRGILLNFMTLLPLLLLISLIIGHLYGPQLRSLPSSDDLPLAKLELLVDKLNNPQTPADEWLADNLSVESEMALRAGDIRKQDLQAALVRDLRRLVVGESIAATEPFRSQLDESDFERRRRIFKKERAKALQDAEAGRPEWAKRLAEWWAGRMRTLADNSRSQLRRQNRLLLETEFPEIRTLEAAYGQENEKLFETGLLPPMPVPFTVTQLALLLALLAVVCSPIVALYLEIAGHRRTLARAGSDSSVRLRDKFELTFAIILLAILAFVLFEVLPILVDQFHQFLVSPKWNWDAIFASVAGVSLAVVGGASKLLTVLGGATKKVAMLFIGLLGVLAPLLVILYATNFLVYHEPLLWNIGDYLVYGAPLDWTPSLLIAVLPIGFVILIVVSMVLGFVNDSFTLSEQLRLAGLALAVIAAMIAMALFLTYVIYPPLEDGTIQKRGPEWNYYLVLIVAVELWVFCRLVVDVNQTSIHGLYRDRLASAYLVGTDTEGSVGIEQDINLGELCCHESGSVAPYHLINVTINLQSSNDISIRDRNSDFFIFSKRFIGGPRTGFCRTETLEQVHPTLSLATAMAVSAAAAAPNMGRGTSSAMVAFMVLLNIRLGYWLPNPGRLEEKLFSSRLMKMNKAEAATVGQTTPGLMFQHVFEQELVDVEKRWENIYSNPAHRQQRNLLVVDGLRVTVPTTEHGLVGLGFSGGGIRSATINLGIVQALHARGIFDHVDYLSTVSGGGYLGSSISTLMRRSSSAEADDGSPSVQVTSRKYRSEIEGVVSVSTNDMGEQIVAVADPSASGERREHCFSKFDSLLVKTGDTVKANQELTQTHDALWDRFRWRVRPWALVREMRSKLDENYNWVNLSDGGHIENLAGIELLRRRCKFIIIGDGEADPELTFNGLATLIRYAQIDLGIEINIHPDPIRIDNTRDAVDKGTANLSREHGVFGTIIYPPSADGARGQEEGFLLYLKSSYTGDENEIIKEYRHRNPSFPHQSTADQFFDENQFECYRALGQHIAEQALQEMAVLEPGQTARMTFDEFQSGFMTRANLNTALAEAALHEAIEKKWDSWLAAQQKLSGSGVDSSGNAR